MFEEKQMDMQLSVQDLSKQATKLSAEVKQLQDTESTGGGESRTSSNVQKVRVQLFFICYYLY